MGLLDDQRGSMQASPRNKLMGLLADALQGAQNYAAKPGPASGGLLNPPLNALAGLLGVQSLATTADRMSYGNALTNFKVANVPFLKPETADALMMAPLSPRTALAAAGMGGLDAGASLAKFAGATAKSPSAVAKMSEMGLEPGWFRGGAKIIDGKRNGPFYTQNADEAAGYAARHGSGSDVREYAIPSTGFLDASRGYSHKLAHDVAAVLDGDYYGKPGAQLAKELRTFSQGEGITGGQLWQSLETRFGNDGAAEVLDKLGAFKGVKGITGPDEAYVFKSAAVRDANKAAFDPARYKDDNILAGLAGATAVGGTTLFGLQGRPRQD